MTRLEAIKQRLLNATPGPWYGKNNIEVWASGHPEAPRPEYRLTTCSAEWDAELIAHAPKDMQLLVEVIEDIQAAFFKDNRIEWYEPEKVKTALAKLEK